MGLLHFWPNIEEEARLNKDLQATFSAHLLSKQEVFSPHARQNEKRFPTKDMSALWSPLRMAQEMGARLGEREVLLRKM
jgi:hypothetical protein